MDGNANKKKGGWVVWVGIAMILLLPFLFPNMDNTKFVLIIVAIIVVSLVIRFFVLTSNK